MSHERPTRIDPETIKQGIDLVEFAQRYTQLTQISRAGEYAGPCPHCGGEDRFHIKDSRFYCRQCYPRGGDIIDLVRHLYEVNFREACKLLAEDADLFSERPLPKPPQQQPLNEHPPLPSSEQESAFFKSARKTVGATSRKLFSPDGESGRTYLQKRGLDEAMWRLFLVGYGTTFHPLRQQNEPAIFIPWLSADGQKIEALRHRFVDPQLAKHERYTLKSGSHPVLFGLHALRPAPQLLIVEGEFNCMALVQNGVVALSLGSETGGQQHETRTQLRTILPEYAHLAIWFDDPRKGQWLAEQLDGEEPFRKEKTQILSHPLDANGLLCQGELAQFLATHQIHTG